MPCGGGEGRNIDLKSVDINFTPKTTSIAVVEGTTFRPQQKQLSQGGIAFEAGPCWASAAAKPRPLSMERATPKGVKDVIARSAAQAVSSPASPSGRPRISPQHTFVDKMSAKMKMRKNMTAPRRRWVRFICFLPTDHSCANPCWEILRRSMIHTPNSHRAHPPTMIRENHLP